MRLDLLTCEPKEIHPRLRTCSAVQLAHQQSHRVAAIRYSG